MPSSLSNREQNKTKKKAKQTPQKKHFKHTHSLSLLSLSLLLSSLSFLLEEETQRFYHQKEFVLYFESDEKRNKKTACVSIGLLAKL